MTGTDGVVVGEARPLAELYRLVTGRAEPTPEQGAIIASGTAPHLVVAGAGSGKTETLSLRIVYLLDHAGDLGRAQPVEPWGKTVVPGGDRVSAASGELLVGEELGKASTQVGRRRRRDVGERVDERCDVGVVV